MKGSLEAGAGGMVKYYKLRVILKNVEKRDIFVKWWRISLDCIVVYVYRSRGSKSWEDKLREEYRKL